MQHLHLFIELTRLNKPIGFMLLFWPCSWGLAYAYYKIQNLNLFLYYLLLFFLGSILMRSAGCIFNDIVDKDLDKKVKRTKVRPIASGRITVERSLSYVFILCVLAFLILLQFNSLTIFLGLSSMFLAFSYPFMKRITYWPQLFLGITFNWGIIMAWSAMNNSLNVDIVILYVSAIFWTLGYDTIYGAQDMSDDEIIGVKSTSLKFKNNLKLFVTVAYSIFVFMIFFLLREFFEVKIIIIFLTIFAFSILYQIYKLDISNAESCLKMFKFNNYTGLLLFLTFLSTNIIK